MGCLDLAIEVIGVIDYCDTISQVMHSVLNLAIQLLTARVKHSPTPK